MNGPAGENLCWRLAPGVIRLRQRRLAGGMPFRIVRLGQDTDEALDRLLGTPAAPDARLALITERLVRYGILLAPAPAPVAVGAGEVTVIVPALGTAHAVLDLLERVPEQVPVIVVDDGSMPPLATGLPDRPGLRVLRHEHPQGPGAARNAGARLAGTTWLAFVDTDIIPADGWLSLLLGRAHPDVVAVAPRVLTEPTSGAHGLIEGWSGALDLGAAPADVGPGRPVSYVPSAVLLVRRSEFEAASGFDRHLLVGEDVDLVWRLARNGRIRYEPDIICRHYARPSLTAVVRRRYDYGTSAAPLELRHPGSLRHVDVSIWSFLPWLLGLTLRPGAGAVAASASIALSPVGLPSLPPTDALRLAARSHTQAFTMLGRWLVRPMWPATLLLAGLLPRSRKALLISVVLGMADLVRRRAPSSPTGLASARSAGKVLLAAAVDDVAYSAGVWAGCLRSGTLAPLLPRIRVGRLGSKLQTATRYLTPKGSSS